MPSRRVGSSPTGVTNKRKMNKLENDLLINAKEQLMKSTKTDWSYGDLDKFRDWAARMRNTITSVCAMMDAMIKQPTKEEE